MGLPFDNEETRISNMEIKPSVRRPKPKLVPMVPLPGSGGHTSRSPRRSSADRSRSPSSRRSESNTSSKMSDGNSSHVCKISKEDVDKMSRKELLDHPISTRLWKEMYSQMWDLTDERKRHITSAQKWAVTMLVYFVTSLKSLRLRKLLDLSALAY